MVSPEAVLSHATQILFSLQEKPAQALVLVFDKLKEEVMIGCALVEIDFIPFRAGATNGFKIVRGFKMPGNLGNGVDCASCSREIRLGWVIYQLTRIDYMCIGCLIGN